MKRVLVIVVAVLTLTAFSAHGGGRTLHIGAMKWEPYTSAALEDGGFYADLVKQAFARSGYGVVIEYYPWKRALHQIKNGDLDGLIGAGYTRERTEFLSYPEFAWETSFHFFSLGIGSDKVEAFDRLCPARLGQVRGSRVTKMVQEQAPCLDIEFVDNVDTNLEKFAYGRIDYMINTPETLFHLFRHKYPEKLKLLKRIEPPLEQVRIYTVFSRQVEDWQAVTEAFDKGIETMKQDGSYEALLAKHNMP